MQLISGEPLVLIGPGSEWFWTAISGVVLAVTFLAIYRQLGAQRAANAFQQVNALWDEWSSEPLTRARLAVFVSLRDGSSLLALPAHGFGRVMNYWEKVAGLVRAGHVPLALVDQSYGSDVWLWWQLLEPKLTKIRLDESEPGIGIDFEWLAQRVTPPAVPRDAREVATRNLEVWIPNLQGLIRDMEATRAVTLISPPA